MNTITKIARHFATVVKHKHFVFIECCKIGIPLQGILHDMSKFSPAEFIPSAKYFQGDRSPIEAEAIEVGYSYAWRNHKGRNRHHWQWYVDFNDDLTLNPAPMPDKYIKEMYCDLVGAGKAYGGESDPAKYYLAHRHEWVLHPETKIKFEKMLGVCKQFL
jgi:hypothetical protein